MPKGSNIENADLYNNHGVLKLYLFMLLISQKFGLEEDFIIPSHSDLAKKDLDQSKSISIHWPF